MRAISERCLVISNATSMSPTLTELHNELIGIMSMAVARTMYPLSKLLNTRHLMENSGNLFVTVVTVSQSCGLTQVTNGRLIVMNYVYDNFLISEILRMMVLSSPLYCILYLHNYRMEVAVFP